MYHGKDQDDHDKYRGNGPANSYFSQNQSPPNSALAGYANMHGQKKEEEKNKKEEQFNEERMREKYKSKEEGDLVMRKKDDSQAIRRQQDEALKAFEQKGLPTLDDALKAVEKAIEEEKKVFKSR